MRLIGIFDFRFWIFDSEASIAQMFCKSKIANVARHRSRHNGAYYPCFRRKGKALARREREIETVFDEDEPDCRLRWVLERSAGWLKAMLLLI
jgi:hypothetical protein